ncbi:type VII secretion-associated serine protease mycosin [Actinoplanes tereljensis]|uniref:Type VII secretion-associated serine protease n=1 Tax=Paractinoplanes tereljensis TaxID=571912 RepID=A0A919TRU2_9ACTN|nr:type VII secretion-associated serine protease mycosin [Actinoplanes tereljensis]GIF18725.1 type VII secretion-associated serine protease [Actinoplanes tereljensis]
MIGRVLAGAAATLTMVVVPAAPALADTTRDQQWYLTDLKIADAHKISRGEGVIVAVIDSGADPDHPDLAGALLPGLDTADSNLAGREGTEDLDGHGTAMSGLIAGRGHGSGDGVLGIAPAAKILPIAAGADGYSSTGFMTKAIDFAIDKHAGVINMSFATGDDGVMQAAIRKAQAADIVLVASAGNDNDISNLVDKYPAKYPEVLAVGAYGKDRKIASISVTGPYIGLSAPGDQIISTDIGATGYKIARGTSDASAIVSGAAALLRAKYPDLSAAEVVHRLTATADDAGPAGRDDTYGYGLLNVVKALTADVAPLPSAAPSGSAVQDAPGDTAASDDLPKAVNVLVPALIVAGLVVLAGVFVAVLMMRRRRSG